LIRQIAIPALIVAASMGAASAQTTGLSLSCLTPTMQRVAKSVGGHVVSTCRRTWIAGSRRLSAHASGMAVDIIPHVRRGAEVRGRAAGATCVIRYRWSPHLHFDERDRC
jgi:hypothetical protein